MTSNTVYIKHKKQIEHFKSRAFKTVQAEEMRHQKIEQEIDASYFSGKLNDVQWELLIRLHNNI